MIIKGWRKKKAREAALVRTQTSLICNAWFQKKVDFQKIWPIPEADGEQKNPMTKRKLHNIFKKAQAQEMERRRLAANN